MQFYRVFCGFRPLRSVAAFSVFFFPPSSKSLFPIDFYLFLYTAFPFPSCQLTQRCLFQFDLSRINIFFDASEFSKTNTLSLNICMFVTVHKQSVNNWFKFYFYDLDIINMAYAFYIFTVEICIDTFCTWNMRIIVRYSIRYEIICGHN